MEAAPCADAHVHRRRHRPRWRSRRAPARRLPLRPPCRLVRWPTSSTASTCPAARASPSARRDPRHRARRGRTRPRPAAGRHAWRRGHRPRTTARSRTTAPAEPMSWRNGSPATAPSHPPASSTSDGVMTMSRGPRARCSRPSTASAAMPTPSANRHRCSRWPSTRSATPQATSASGSRNRPRPTKRAEPGVDPTSQRPGDAEVDGQGDQRADHDEDQPEQVPPVRVERAADRGGPRRGRAPAAGRGVTSRAGASWSRSPGGTGPWPGCGWPWRLP